MNAKTRTPSQATRSDIKTRRLRALAAALWLLAAGSLFPTRAGAQPPGGGGGGSSTSVTYYATYKLNGGTATQSNQMCAAAAADTSGAWVTNSGVLTLNSCTITTSGNSSSLDSSSFYGLNAGVLAESQGKVTMTGGSVTTTGRGANGVFAYGSGASAVLSGVTIDCTAQGGHAVMTSGGGSLTVTNVNMTTRGPNSGAIATDRGGGTITVTGGTVTTSGQDSPAIYSTGTISVSDATLSATGAEAAVIEGANSITLTNTALSSSKDNKWGVMIYQSMSGDAQGTRGVFTMTGGSLANTAPNGPLFYVTNSTGIITLQGVQASARSGTFLKAATGNWGTSGKNGGTAVLTADGQTLTGDLVADSSSSITATLKNGSILTGATSKADLTIDATSTWAVPAASTLTKLTTAGTISLGSPADTVTVAGAARLGGKLVVNLGNAPAAGTYTLITAGSVSGTFSSFEFSNSLPCNSVATLNYSATAVTLVITQAAATICFPNPSGLALDANHILYVADASSNTISRVTATGVVTPWAGATGTAGSTDETGAKALFNQPAAVAATAASMVYVADSANATIRQITPAGVVTTFAGSAVSRGHADGLGTAATFSRPVGLAVDVSGNLYVADATNHTIRKITPAGAVTTCAGTAGVAGSTDGTGPAALFHSPSGIAIDNGGNVYVADTGNNTIRQITPAGVVTTLAGLAGFSGSADGAGTSARFNQPSGLALDAAGSLYVADTGNSVIRRVTAAGVVTTFAGLSTVAGRRDATGTAALFNQPKALACDSGGNLYVADAGNAALGVITPVGVVTTVSLSPAPQQP
jgi:sugar lactone lactonase YvrE